MFPVKRLNKPVSDAQHPGRGLYILAPLSEVFTKPTYRPAPVCTDISFLLRFWNIMGFKTK